MQFVPKGFAICLFMEAIVFARNPIKWKKEGRQHKQWWLTTTKTRCYYVCTYLRLAVGLTLSQVMTFMELYILKGNTYCQPSWFHPLHYINVLNLAILCSKFTRATFYRVCRKQTYREFKELTNDNVDKSKFQCMSAYTHSVRERVERERERERER